MDFSNFLGYLNPSAFVYSAIVGLLTLAYWEWRKIGRLARAEIMHASPKMMEIAGMIKEGSMAYLLRQFKVLLVVESIIAIALLCLINIHVAVAFSIGAFLSWLCGFLSMYISVSANYKVTLLAQLGFKEAFNGAFSVGKAVGFLVTGVALDAVFMSYQYAQCCGQDVLIQVLIGLSFGASLITVFARIGGGIFTKGADIGADLVGKIEKNIPEDDARNPAVIADNVGDNVGDCAGMAADLFESYIVIVSAAIALASCVFSGNFINNYISLIFVVLASGAWSSIFTLFGGWHYNKKAKFASQGIALKTLFFATVITLDALAFFFWGMEGLFSLAICVLTGLAVGVLVLPITEYFTATNFKPVKDIVRASSQGHAPNVIQGIAVGFSSCFIPLLIIAKSILFCMLIAGVFGLALACVSMISICAVVLALDAFGPVTDNAGGLAEMGGLDKSVRVVTDELDEIGNMTKATTKGYAVYSAALATLVLLTTFKTDLAKVFGGKALEMDIASGAVIAGLFLGAAVVGLFAGITLLAVNKASAAIIDEVREQFRAMPGILLGTERPNYAKAVDILTKASLRQMILPGLLPVLGLVLSFFAIRFWFNLEFAFSTVAGFMVGASIVGIFLACAMTISGGAWDNAKKSIESSGNKGSLAHQAAVTGDTIGDPYKDTTGPAINPMIKIIGIVAILLIMMHS